MRPVPSNVLHFFFSAAQQRVSILCLNLHRAEYAGPCPSPSSERLECRDDEARLPRRGTPSP